MNPCEYNDQGHPKAIGRCLATRGDAVDFWLQPQRTSKEVKGYKEIGKEGEIFLRTWGLEVRESCTPAMGEKAKWRGYKNDRRRLGGVGLFRRPVGVDRPDS